MMSRSAIWSSANGAGLTGEVDARLTEDGGRDMKMMNQLFDQLAYITTDVD